MNLPNIQITERDIAIRTEETPGGYAVLLLQAERGPLEATLVANASYLLDLYTAEGFVPTDIASRTGYYSAINYLKESNSLWIKRVVPSGNYPAYYSAAHILLEDSYTMAVTLNTADETKPRFSVTASPDPKLVVIWPTDGGAFPFATGDPVTPRGAHLPAGIVNGMRYYLKVDPTGQTYTIRFHRNYADAVADPYDVSTAEAITNATYSPFDLLTASDSVRGGIAVGDLANLTPGPADAFVLYAANPGKWGNKVHVTVEVQRYVEDGLHCAEAIDLETGAFPVASTWAGVTASNEPVPVCVVPEQDMGASNEAMPQLLDNSYLDPTTVYHVARIDGTHIALTDTVDPAAASIAFKAAGTGKVRLVPLGYKMTVTPSDITYGNGSKLDLSELSGKPTDGIASGTKIVFYGRTLPAPLVPGRVYYAKKIDANNIRVNTDPTVPDALDIVFTSAVNVTENFTLYVYPTEETVSHNKNGDAVEADNDFVVAQGLQNGTPVKIAKVNPEDTLPANLNTTDTFYLGLVSGKYYLYASQTDLWTDVNAGTVNNPVVLGDNSEAAVSFKIVPQVVTDQEVDLEGAINYVSGEIRLKNFPELSNQPQGWVAGEAVKVFAKGSGSRLPQGLRATGTYFLVPVASGVAKLYQLATTSLSSVLDLQPVALSSEHRGVGYMSIAPAAQALDEGTFRVKVWKTAYRRVGASSAANVVSVSLVEEHVCSLRADLQDQAGRALFIEDRLGNSAYIRAKVSSTVDQSMDAEVPVKASPFLVTLTGGADGGVGGTGAVTSAELIDALASFLDQTDKPASYFLDGGYTLVDYQNELIQVAETRGDAIAILSTPQTLEDESDPSRAIIEWRRTNMPSSSYAMLFTPWQVIGDPTLGRDVVCPPDGFVGAAMAKVDRDLGPWFATAGKEWGVVKAKRGNIEFTIPQMDDMYTNGINSITRYEGVGQVIWGNRTLYGLSSPLRAGNVRKLFNRIQTDLGKTLKDFIYRPVTTATRDQIVAVCESYLRSLVTQQGIADFQVVCDSTNNTATDEDAQRINVWLFVRPVQVAEYIKLMTVVTNSSISFETALSTVASVQR